MTAGERVFTAWAGSSKIPDAAIPTWEGLYPAERERWELVATAADAPTQSPADASEVVVVPREVEYLIDRLKKGARDLHPYSLGEVASPALNVALPAYLNEAADLIRSLYAAPPAPSGDSGAWEALEKIADEASPFDRTGEPLHVRVSKDLSRRVGIARQALALRDAGGGSLPPAAPSSVPSGDVDGGAGHD